MKTEGTAPAIVRNPIDLSCPKCLMWIEGPEIYSVTRFTDNSVLVWDIELARYICSDGRASVCIASEHLDDILRVNQTEPKHLDHVDPSVPGIACAFGYAGETPIFGLIDGSHGSARCRRDGIPFRVHVLTDQESLRCQDRVRQRLVEFLAHIEQFAG